MEPVVVGKKLEATLQKLADAFGVPAKAGFRPPYPISPPAGASIEEFFAMRRVVTGQLFGDTELPEA